MGRITINLFLAFLVIGSFVQANPFFFGQQGQIKVTVTDNFDSYAANSDLGSQANWATVEGAFTIKKPSTLGRANPNSSAHNCSVRRTLPVFTANQSSEITLFISSSQSPIGASVRNQSGSATYYDFHYDRNSGAIFVGQINAGTWSQVYTTSKTYVNGDKLKIEATGTGSGTRINIYEDTGSGWVAIQTNLDPSVDIDGGQPGVYGFSNNASDTADSIESWTGSDL